MIEGLWPLGGLFASAFLSATLLPGSSEMALAAVQLAGAAPLWLAILVATIGNTAGSIVNWALGRFAEKWRGSRWFPATDAQIAKAQDWWRRYGIWSLALCWVPVIGDPLTLIAGLMRTPLLATVAIVGSAKLARYLAVTGLVALW